VLVSNHPQLAGGSHLPDITVITPVFEGGEHNVRPLNPDLARNQTAGRSSNVARCDWSLQ
jgi:hypothetical protein